MTDSIIPTGSVDEAKAFIADLRRQIDERRHECHEKIQRIRDRARADEDYELERAHLEILPLRKQMEAMTLTLVEYESLKAPAPMIVEKSALPGGDCP